MRIEEIVELASVIPVIEIGEAEKAARLAEALAAGGLRVVELTLRTGAALDALALMKRAAPNLVVGMGTIRGEKDIERSLACGADFLVSPGAPPPLLAALADAGAPALPGVATASEAMAAKSAGFSALKFFPAEAAGGVAYLKALAGPFPDIRFCPTGGIGPDLAPHYFAIDNVSCVGGSWIAPKEMIERSAWDEVEANARRAASMKPR